MAKFIYNKKFYRNWFVRKFITLSRRVGCFFDSRKDKKICGCSLVKYVPSKYRESMGATGSQSTTYRALDIMFRDFEISADDSFIDVGCGKGRLLAYMIRKKYPCRSAGIELNDEVASYAKNWADKYEQLTVISGNAFELDYNDYTVLFMGRPFEPDMFHQFIDQLEEKLTHSIRLIYWVDQQSGSYLEDRKGWTMLRRENVFFSRGMFLCQTPQRYSIWVYNP